MLLETPKNKGAKGSKVTGTKQEPVRDDTATLASQGIDEKTSARAQKLAGLQSETFFLVRSGNINLDTATWLEKQHANTQNFYRTFFTRNPGADEADLRAAHSEVRKEERALRRAAMNELREATAAWSSQEDVAVAFHCYARDLRRWTDSLRAIEEGWSKRPEHDDARLREAEEALRKVGHSLCKSLTSVPLPDTTGGDQ